MSLDGHAIPDPHHDAHPAPTLEQQIRDARAAFLNAAPKFAADPAGAERMFLMLLKGLGHEHTPTARD